MNDERQVMGVSYEPRTQNYELKATNLKLDIDLTIKELRTLRF